MSIAQSSLQRGVGRCLGEILGIKINEQIDDTCILFMLGMHA